MARVPADPVKVLITLDDALARRLQEQAARRSLPLAAYVEEIVRVAALKPAPSLASEAEGDAPSAETLPSSTGLADVDFDARDTDAWLAAHWGRE